MGLSAAEWIALPWHLRRMYLDGMEQDESVPLSFEPQAPQAPELIPGMQVRGAPPAGADVIGIDRMLGELDASRHRGGR